MVSRMVTHRMARHFGPICEWPQAKESADVCSITRDAMKVASMILLYPCERGRDWGVGPPVRTGGRERRAVVSVRGARGSGESSPNG